MKGKRNLRESEIPVINLRQFGIRKYPKSDSIIYLRMEREDFFVRKRRNPSENKEKEIFSRRQGSVNK